MKPSSPSQTLQIPTSKPLGWFSKVGAITVALSSMAVPAVHAIVIDTGTLTFSPAVGYTGQENLKNNAMIIRTGNIATITGYLQTGIYNGPNGYWDGPGINSSVAAANASQVTSLGVLNNANFGFTDFPYDVNYAPVAGSHSTPLGTEIFVKYTYYGDADLNGVVDNGADLNSYLIGLGGGGVGWEFGDFDYSGGATDTGGDLNQYLIGLGGQGAPLVSQGSVFAAVAQVPEPSAIGMLLLGTLGLFSRRIPRSLRKE